jgi:hypothetical protein
VSGHVSMTPPCSPVFPAAVIARLDSTETHRPFDADEEDRRNDEDDEQEELERQERHDQEDGEDIYSDDLRGNFVRPALPFDRYSSRISCHWKDNH